MNEFETFKKLVEDYWPRCKTTEEQLRVHWENRVCHHPPGVVSAALSKCLSEYPDDTAPKWKIIFGYLAGRSERDGVAKSEFELLLNYSREASKGDHVPGSGNLSDEDAWLRWLRVMTQSTLQSGDDRPCARPGCSRHRAGSCELSERECWARDMREREASTWRQYLVDRAEPIPAFLADGYGDDVFVEPKEAKATLF